MGYSTYTNSKYFDTVNNRKATHAGGLSSYIPGMMEAN